MEVEKELYLNNYKRKSFQWELWQECSNGCIFCYIGKDNKNTRVVRKLNSLNDFQKILDNFDHKKYNNISLIGGEFFQGQLETEGIKEKFINQLKQIGQLYKDRKIGSSWLSITLTMGNQEELYNILNYYKENNIFIPHKDYNSSGLWLCTSWDTKGRFHTQTHKDNWEYHMLKIQREYSFVKFNTTIILTEPFIIDYLRNKFTFREFCNKYKTTIFLKQPITGSRFNDELYGDIDKITEEEFKKKFLDLKQKINNIYGWNFFPKRELFLEFLFKLKKEDENIFNSVCNINYRADELHRNFNYKEHDAYFERRKIMGCEINDGVNYILNECKKHIMLYAPYSNCNDCLICDKLMISNI